MQSLVKEYAVAGAGSSPDASRPQRGDFLAARIPPGPVVGGLTDDGGFWTARKIVTAIVEQTIDVTRGKSCGGGCFIATRTFYCHCTPVKSCRAAGYGRAEVSVGVEGAALVLSAGT